MGRGELAEAAAGWVSVQGEEREGEGALRYNCRPDYPGAPLADSTTNPFKNAVDLLYVWQRFCYN